MMLQQLTLLDGLLSKLRPDFYADLNEPLSAAAIQELESKYNRTLPDDLKALYQWKNGQKSSNYAAFVNNSMFIKLEDNLDSAQLFTSMIGFDFEVPNWWHPAWIPIFHNGGGVYICYDMEGVFTKQQGQLVVFRSRDNDRNVIASSLESFFAALVTYYTNTPASQFDEYFKLPRIDGFPKKFYV